MVNRSEKEEIDMQRILEGIARLERPQDKYPDTRSLEVRPILPMDLGLKNWVWSGDNVKLQPQWNIAFYGIHSRYLLLVALRTSGKYGNMVACVSTGQPLYEPYLWKKQEARWVTWEYMEDLPLEHTKGIPFSILGFVIEPMGMTIA